MLCRLRAHLRNIQSSRRRVTPTSRSRARNHRRPGSRTRPVCGDRSGLEEVKSALAEAATSHLCLASDLWQNPFRIPNEPRDDRHNLCRHITALAIKERKSMSQQGLDKFIGLIEHDRRIFSSGWRSRLMMATCFSFSCALDAFPSCCCFATAAAFAAAP
jgi:hypothetical protein